MQHVVTVLFAGSSTDIPKGMCAPSLPAYSLGRGYSCFQGFLRASVTGSHAEPHAQKGLGHNEGLVQCPVLALFKYLILYNQGHHIFILCQDLQVI